MKEHLGPTKVVANCDHLAKHPPLRSQFATLDKENP